MRVTENQLVAQLVANVSHIEGALLFANLRIEDNVEENITQFFANVQLVILQKGFAQFISFLNCVGTQRLICLFSVPRTLFAEVVHHVEQTPESLHFFLL